MYLKAFKEHSFGIFSQFVVSLHLWTTPNCMSFFAMIKLVIGPLYKSYQRSEGSVTLETPRVVKLFLPNHWLHGRKPALHNSHKHTDRLKGLWRVRGPQSGQKSSLVGL